MSDRVGYELLEIPDTPPDHLATQDGGRLRSYSGARRQRSVCFRRRGGEDEKLSSKEQDQTVRERATLGSHLSSHSGGTSCRLQYSLRRDGFTQKQDHQQCRSSSSECFHPPQYLCHHSEGLPTEPHMETCTMSRKDENNQTLNIDELFQTAREEVKRKDKNTTSSHAIPTPIRNRRKMLVRNGRISPNGIAADEAMSNKSMKRLRDATVEGHVMNDESADANSFISCDTDFEPNNISLPISAQQEDRRKGKAIVSGDMFERDEKLQRRKRIRGNSSSSGEVNRLSVCRDATSPRPHCSSGLATQGMSQACRNHVSLNRSRDLASEGKIKFTHKPQVFSRAHRNERQQARHDKARGDLPPLSLFGDQRNSSGAGSPEVVFLRSCRSSQRNPFSSFRTSNVLQESICDVEVDDRSPIDVDSLQYPINETVDLEKSNNEAIVKARQIEQDEILARQLQEEFTGQELEGGLQTGFRTGGRREPSLSFATHPSLPPFLASHPTISPHRRDAASGRWHRTSGRPFRSSRFQFPSHMNIEMRVDMLEAMEHAVENNATHRLLAGVQRDFNENDYEMLLALDDDNGNCKGASKWHIDRLPISTVQNDISDEVCSVCLEMPESGEVIRHLLCMHKFHKECIDPWLAKQACCPICKLSI